MTTIRCHHCSREMTIEKRDTDERLARRRWFLVSTTWDTWYQPSYRVVCGGNDKGLFRKVIGTLRRDLFPDGKGGLVERDVEPGFKEIDSCMEAEAKMSSASSLGGGLRQLAFAGPQGGEYTRGIATGEEVAHLFIPDMGTAPDDIEKSHDVVRA